MRDHPAAAAAQARGTPGRPPASSSRRWRPAAGAALALLSLMTPLGAATAQNTVVDEGTLVIQRDGATIGRETFRIVEVAGEERVLMATAQVTYGARRLAPALSVGTDGRPLLYRLELREDGQVRERVQATARPGRFSVLLKTAEGEAARDYVLAAGALLVDDEIFHQHAFLAASGLAAPGAGALTVVVPRGGRQLRGQLRESSADTLEVGGRRIPATRLVLALTDGVREIWVDSRRRLLKVHLPARGLTALREEPPR